jgi:hypothetical protein
LEAFDFYMRTESAATNPVYVAVLDVFGNILAQGNLNLATAPNGGWYTVTLNFPLVFGDGEPFAILAGASRAIPFPAGTDVDAAVPHQSFYFNPLTNSYVNLNTSAGFQNGAFLIRAEGTKSASPTCRRLPSALYPRRRRWSMKRSRLTLRNRSIRTARSPNIFGILATEQAARKELRRAPMHKLELTPTPSPSPITPARPDKPRDKSASMPRAAG